MVKQFIKKAKVLSVGAVMAFAMIASAVTSIAASKPAYAASSCDKVNIVYCGVNKGSAASDISTFKSTYSNNKSGHAASPTVKKDYTDLKTVYNWAGASESIVSGMNTTNTKLGTLYKDGRIVVDGKVVATDSWVTARYNNGAGFTKVTGNVFARKTTTSFAEASAPVLVNFQNGKMAFAVMTGCGNAVKGTPKTPEQPPKPPETPKPVMSCDLLTGTKQGDYDYTFVAKANAENAKITNYAFDFGDGQSKNVPTAAESATATHKYAKAGTFTASVKVTFTANGKTTTLTAAKCATPANPTQPPTKPEECKPGIPVGDARCEEKPVPAYACTELLITPNKDNSLQYNFTVKATAENAKIDAYIVDFGDGTPAYDGAATSVDHTYGKAGTYNTKASIRVTANGKTEVVTAANCAKKVTIEQPMCTVPGKETLPVNSPECKETPVTPPTTPETPKTPTTPTELPNTGAGSMVGLFSGFSIAGTAAHRLISRRRNS